MSNPVKKNEQRRQLYHSLEAKSLRSRSLLTNIADLLTSFTGTPNFLIANVIFFILWILINVNFIPGIVPFDPYPFGFLTMMVSLEAIFLSIFVLISQNRSSYISTMREEVSLRVNLIAEEEITKILEILAEVRKKVGITSVDPELEEMLKRTDTNYLERSIEDQVARASKPIFQQLKKELPGMIKKAMQTPTELVNESLGEDRRP
ncbi:MAG TPA: DUF1003 domain-containing protein [Candidatus Nitrosocosmicus sp.]|nr:DUF1003 domain-containing protein [Candidatus Nitrosocosmicus sp.]